MSRVTLSLALGAAVIVIVLLAVGYRWIASRRSAPGPAATAATATTEEPDTLEARQARDLAAVERATSAQELKPFVSSDLTVARAALMKLARMGDTADICQAFDAAPRRTGTGARGGVKALALEALAATGKPEARQFVEQTVDRYLQDGPAVATYSHIYDPQYYEVLQAGLGALGSFDDPALDAKLETIAGDESRFYTIRETAYGVGLAREMRRQNLSTPSLRSAWLMTRLDVDGVPAEKWWKGDKPGSKTQPAAREAAVEALLVEQGWEARAALGQCVSADTNEWRRVAAARVLSRLVVQHLSAAKPGDATTEDKAALLAILDGLSSTSASTLASPTVYRVMAVVKTGADALNDADVNGRCRAIQPRLARAGAWTGAAPGQDVLGVSLPPGATFVADYSTRTETPYGTFVRAGYVTDQKPQDVVQFFEQATSSKAVASNPGTPEQGQASRYFISFGQRQEVAGLEGLVDLGITVLDFPGGFEEKAFGEAVRKATTVFYVSAIGPRSRR